METEMETITLEQMVLPAVQASQLLLQMVIPETESQTELIQDYLV